MKPVEINGTVGRKKAPRRRWPLKADYKRISRAQALSLVTEFVAWYGLDVLRTHRQFRNATFSRVEHLDTWDLREAIDVAICRLADRDPSDIHQQRLWERLEAHCGAFDQPVAVTIGPWPLVYPSGAVSN